MVGPCSLTLKNMLNPSLSFKEMSCQTIRDGKVKAFNVLLLLFISFGFYFVSIFTIFDILQVNFLMESLM